MSFERQPEFIFTSRLRFLIIRFIQISKTFQDSLKTEFWPSADTKKAWMKELNWLSRTSWPIHAILDKSTIHGEQHDRYCNFLKVIDYFLRSSKSPNSSEAMASDWFDIAIEKLGYAMKEAIEWENFLANKVDLLKSENINLSEMQDGVVYDELKRIYPSLTLHPGKVSLRKSRQVGFQRLQNAARNYIENDGNAEERDRESCLASRQLFLTAHLIRYFYPDMWTRQEQTQFIALHSKISPLLRENTAFKRSFDYRMEEVEGTLMDKFQYRSRVDSLSLNTV